MDNFNPNLSVNPFTDFDDDDEYEQAMEMGDRFFGSRGHRKPLSKAEQDQENFVLLNDNYGEYLDPPSILAIFDQCGRDMDQTITTIEEVIGSSTNIIDGDSSTGSGGGGGSSSSFAAAEVESNTPCEFWGDNGWCIRGCNHLHDTVGYPCIYYNRKYKICPGGKKCKFMHETIDEQMARIECDADDSQTYMNYEGMYKYEKLSKDFANFLRQIKENHDSVCGPLIDIVFDYM